MSDITGHDDGTLQVDTGRDGILAEFLTNSVDTLIEVDGNGVGTLTSLGILSRNQFRRIRVHLLQPDTVGIDLRLDVAVGRAADTHADRTAGTMTRQTNHTDIVSQILTTELGTQANLMSLLQEFLFEVDIAEGTTSLVACGGQTVVELDGSQLHGQQVLLGRSTTNDECDVIRRTSCCTQ